jgi:integrase
VRGKRASTVRGGADGKGQLLYLAGGLLHLEGAGRRPTRMSAHGAALPPYATHLLEASVSIRVLQLWMGHASPSTTAIDTHLTQQVQQTAAKALDELTAGMP